MRKFDNFLKTTLLKLTVERTDRKRHLRFTLLRWFIFILLYFVVSIYFGWDGMIFLFLLFIASILYLSALFDENRSRLYKASSLLIIVHLMLFPLLYVYLLNGDTTSFKIDEDIERNLIVEAKKDAEHEFQAKNNKRALSAINKMLGSESPSLKLVLPDGYYNFNVLRIDTFILYSRQFDAEMRKAPYVGDVIFICDGVGREIAVLQKNLSNGFSANQTFKNSEDFLLKAKVYLEAQNVAYQQNLVNIEEKRYWTYAKILPHSTLIFNLDHIVPKKTSANLLYLFHMILVPFLILSLFSEQLLSLLNKNRDSETE